MRGRAGPSRRQRLTLTLLVLFLVCAALTAWLWPSGSPAGRHRDLVRSAAGNGNSSGTLPVGTSVATTPPTTAVAVTTTTVQPTRTSCQAVVHIGESTSVGLISAAYLPDPATRMDAQYARIGIANRRFEISGARSIVETLPGQVNAYDTAARLVAHGFRGCWVLALGTDDTADVAVGSRIGRMVRIDRMMSVIGTDPVLWVNTKTLKPSGPYSSANMQLWNVAVSQASTRYSNLYVYDWASVAQDGWFQTDGIHYTSTGYAARAHMIADALASAFPG